MKPMKASAEILRHASRGCATSLLVASSVDGLDVRVKGRATSWMIRGR